MSNTSLFCAVAQAFSDILRRDMRINFAKLLESEAFKIPGHISTGQAGTLHSGRAFHNIRNSNDSLGHVHLSFINRDIIAAH
jgi:hypothetical protein